VLALGTDEGRKPDTPGWEVRVVPNKYPAFERQEVVVHSPEHQRSLAELDREQLDLVAEAWRLRAEAARAQGTYLFAGVNEGRAAGASLLHSHSQLVWLSEEPPVPSAERGESCRLCEYLERELAEGARVV
jgi:UDPglucose--hexose-1-phosphate uridylyltransferase